MVFQHHHIVAVDERWLKVFQHHHECWAEFVGVGGNCDADFVDFAPVKRARVMH